MAYLSAKEKRIRENSLKQQAFIAKKYSGKPTAEVRDRFYAPPYGTKVSHEDKK